MCFFEWKATQGHKSKIKFLTKHFPQIAMVIDFSQLKGQILAISLFIVHHPFKKKSLITKNLNIVTISFAIELLID